MTRRELTAEEIEAFRRKVVDAARTLFVEHGVGGVTMRAIAVAIGCSPMRTYRYFDDREAVLEALRAEAFCGLADSQEEAAASSRSVRRRLDAIRAAYLRFGLEHPDSYRLMFSLESMRPPGEAFQKQATRAFGTLRTTVANAIEGGHLEGDADTVAHLIWVELHGVVSLHLSQKLNKGRSLEQIAAASPWRMARRK
ncbi:MAG: TetR/AcrR family transcriptional regulator [Nannocystales bacterium]